MRKSILFIIFLCIEVNVFAQAKAEKLKIVWPSEWKVIGGEYERKRTIEILIPQNEKLRNWSVLGTYICVRKKPENHVDSTIKVFLVDMKKIYGDSRIKVLEKDTLNNSWAIIQAEEMFDRPSMKQQSAIYYIRTGKSNYFETSVRIKGRDLPAGFSEKWSALFKKSELYYEF